MKELKALEYLVDGVYDMTGIEYLKLSDNFREVVEDHEHDERYQEYYQESRERATEFVVKHPNAVIACAYGTVCSFLLASRPQRLTGRVIGDGFNYGSTNIITNCPQSILILAEDD